MVKTLSTLSGYLERRYGPAIGSDGEHNEKVCARMDPDPDACVAPACAREKRRLAKSDEIERSRALLKRIEWEAPGWAGVNYCHFCGGYRLEGHRSDCKLAALVGET